MTQRPEQGDAATAVQPFDRILSAVEHGICVLDQRARISYMNRAAEHMTGLAGATDAPSIDDLRSTDSPYSAATCPIRATLSDGQPRRSDGDWFRSHDGSAIAVRYACQALTDEAGAVTGAVLTFADASEHMDSRRYRALAHINSDLIWRCTADGRLVYISEYWLALAGADMESVADWAWTEVLHPDDREAYVAAWKHAIATGEPFQHEYRMVAQDGSTRRIFDRAVPVRNDDGHLFEWIGAGQDITERAWAIEELRNQREQYRTLVESTSAILWQADPTNFQMTYISPEAEKLLGYPAQRWIDEPEFWTDHMHPEDRAWAPQFCAEATARQEEHSFDYRMIAADGRTVWLRDVVSVLVEDGRPVALVGVMVDITSTKEAERALAYVSGLQRILVEATEQLVTASSEEIDERLTETLKRVTRYCGADRGAVIHFDPGGTTAAITHEWHDEGIEPVGPDLIGSPGETAPNLLEHMRRRQVLHVPRVRDMADNWRTERETFQRHGIRSVLIVPLITRDGLLGCVGFDSLREERDWNDDHIRLLQGLADIIGAILQEISANRARAASEARFRAIADHLPGAVYERVRDPDGTVRLSYLSPGSESVFGIDRQRALSDPRVVLESVHPNDRQAYRTALETSAQQLSPLDFSYRTMRADGRVLWARLLGEPQLEADGAVSWRGIVIDETERVEAQQTLRQSRALQEIAERSACVGGWVCDLAEQRVKLSDQVCAIHDLPPGTSLTVEQGLSYYAPEWQPRMSEAFAACARRGTPYDEEPEFISASGKRLWVRAIGEPVRDDSGRIVQVRGAFQDITAQKRAQQKAKRLAERLRRTLESITDAFFMVDHHWRYTYLNREAERQMRVAREDILGREVWSVYPDLCGTAVEHEFRHAMEDNRAITFEFYYDQFACWYDINVYPSDEGLAIYFRDITERKRSQEEIEFLALYDPLTRLPNRRLLLDRLKQALATAERTGLLGAILFLDLDHFKTLNDTRGHDVGDRMLQQVARRLEQCVRANDTVARFGGDEFAIVLQDLSADPNQAIADAGKVGEKIRAELAHPYQLGEQEHQSSLSVGITLFGDDPEDTPDEIMKRADLAMYQSKDAGRGTVRLFDPAMRAALQSRAALQADLRGALERGEILPWYQPQLDDKGRIIGAEALARWVHPELGTISPAHFIPIAEETGVILELGDSILEMACAQAAAWTRQPETAGLTVSVNVSARQFHRPEFADQVRAIVARTGIPPELLWLELTESLLLADVEDTIRTMSTLRAEGIRFTLDDFGTGYSSLGYLKRLPLDQLKIDQSFVRDALTDPSDDAIVRTIIILAETMGMSVVAEGVETEAIRERMAQHGCRAYQGYLYSAPLPADQFDELVRNYRTATVSPGNG